MYQLYYSPGSAAMVPHALLEEIGAPYELRLLDTDNLAQKSPDYLKLNPAGRVPTLVDGDLVLFETGAITLHLLGKHTSCGLMPKAGSADHSRFLQWLFYLSTTPQVTFIEFFYPERWAAGSSDTARVKTNASARLQEQFALLDQAIGPRPYFLGEACSALDIYLTMLTRWSRFLERPMWHSPNIRRVAATVRTRPAFQRMMSKQGIAWPDSWPAG